MRQKLSPDVKRLFLIYFLATKVHKKYFILRKISIKFNYYYLQKR